ncbi:MAG TPA: Rrf2 family transcriptional regulator [Planctomycetaceae bacterium]|nr:Rrf2 family transcriptional regulator [Planctomycetaceae bacterium]
MKGDRFFHENRFFPFGSFRVATPAARYFLNSHLMKISAKTEYACIAVMELAANKHSNVPVRIRNIAEKHNVPPRFLVQILLQLKGAAIVSSIRGASGGYQLTRGPEQITLGEVMNIIDAPARAGKRSSAAPTVGSSTVGVLTKAWENAERKRQDHLNDITFADLVRMAEEGNV